MRNINTLFGGIIKHRIVGLDIQVYSKYYDNPWVVEISKNG
jgi:hypothetical protein